MTQQLKIEQYNKDLPLIADLRALIREKYADLFYAVIVHGSVATNEVIPYSDFDGLLIIKDEFANSKQLQRFKLDSMRLILKFDPLQHHGWFQIKESDLRKYPESYLPCEILNYSKLIYPIQDNIELDISINNQTDYNTGLNNMLNSFENRIKTNWKPKNLYQLKSVLSQVMLLPSLYFAAKYKEGIFKKFSFKAVRNDFDNHEWYVIDKASELRSTWHCQLNIFQKLIMSRPERLFRKLTQKYVAPKLNDNLHWDDHMSESMKLLILKMKTIINEVD